MRYWANIVAGKDEVPIGHQYFPGFRVYVPSMKTIRVSGNSPNDFEFIDLQKGDEVADLKNGVLHKI